MTFTARVFFFDKTATATFFVFVSPKMPKNFFEMFAFHLHTLPETTYLNSVFFLTSEKVFLYVQCSFLGSRIDHLNSHDYAFSQIREKLQLFFCEPPPEIASVM